MKKVYFLIIIVFSLFFVGCIDGSKESGDSTICQEQGHTYGEWKIIIEPTETAPGLKQKVCGVCGDIVEEQYEECIHTLNKTEILYLNEFDSCHGVLIYKTCFCKKEKYFTEEMQELFYFGCEFETVSEEIIEENNKVKKNLVYKCKNCSLQIKKNSIEITRTCWNALGKPEEFKYEYYSEYNFKNSKDEELNFISYGPIIDIYSDINRKDEVRTLPMEITCGSEYVVVSDKNNEIHLVDFTYDNNCDLEKIQNSYYDEDQNYHEYQELKCNKCGVVLRIDMKILTIGCYKYVEISSSLNLSNGEILVEGFTIASEYGCNYKYNLKDTSSTCDEGAEIEVNCDECGDSFVTKSYEHETYERDKKVTKEPSLFEPGVIEYTCERCNGVAKTEEIKQEITLVLNEKDEYEIEYLYVYPGHGYEILIPESYNGKPITTIKSRAINARDTIIYIPKTIQNIDVDLLCRESEHTTFYFESDTISEELYEHLKHNDVIIGYERVSVDIESCIKVGENSQINVKVFPKKDMENIIFTSSDTSVADVDETGIISAKTTGIVTITITHKTDKNISYTFELEIIEKMPNLNEYTIKIAQSEHALYEMNPFDDKYKGDDKEARQKAWLEVEKLFNCIIEITPYPSFASWGQYRWDYIIQASQGNGVDFDFYTVPNTQIPTFVDAGALVDLTEYYQKYGDNTIDSETIKSVSYNNHIYGIYNIKPINFDYALVMVKGKDYSYYGNECTPENIYRVLLELNKRTEKYINETDEKQ